MVFKKNTALFLCGILYDKEWILTAVSLACYIVIFLALISNIVIGVKQNLTNSFNIKSAVVLIRECGKCILSAAAVGAAVGNDHIENLNKRSVVVVVLQRACINHFDCVTEWVGISAVIKFKFPRFSCSWTWIGVCNNLCRYQSWTFRNIINFKCDCAFILRIFTVVGCAVHIAEIELFAVFRNAYRNKLCTFVEAYLLADRQTFFVVCYVKLFPSCEICLSTFICGLFVSEFILYCFDIVTGNRLESNCWRFHICSIVIESKLNLASWCNIKLKAGSVFSACFWSAVS